MVVVVAVGRVVCRRGRRMMGVVLLCERGRDEMKRQEVRITFVSFEMVWLVCKSVHDVFDIA